MANKSKIQSHFYDKTFWNYLDIQDLCVKKLLDTNVFYHGTYMFFYPYIISSYDIMDKLIQNQPISLQYRYILPATILVSILRRGVFDTYTSL